MGSLHPHLQNGQWEVTLHESAHAGVSIRNVLCSILFGCNDSEQILYTYTQVHGNHPSRTSVVELPALLNDSRVGT